MMEISSFESARTDRTVFAMYSGGAFVKIYIVKAFIVHNIPSVLWKIKKKADEQNSETIF